MTTTENKTLSFPFGETPEEVIREQHEWLLSPEGVSLRVLRFEGDLGNAVAIFPTDDLLTVLDALVAASESETFVGKPNIGDALTTHAATQNARQLRIQILAALGIDEGGA